MMALINGLGYIMFVTIAYNNTKYIENKKEDEEAIEVA